MRVTIRNGNELVMVRDQNDSPIVADDGVRPKNRKDYNAMRSDYTLLFRTEQAAMAAANKIKDSDFDTAAAWLDKQ